MWAAVLATGICDLCSPSKEVRELAEVWLRTTKESLKKEDKELQPGDFEWICETLDIDAEALRVAFDVHYKKRKGKHLRLFRGSTL